MGGMGVSGQVSGTWRSGQEVLGGGWLGIFAIFPALVARVTLGFPL